jgi:cold shock CspA family protein
MKRLITNILFGHWNHKYNIIIKGYKEFYTIHIIHMSMSKQTGRVKWFNTKSGYGFITITDGPNSGTDVYAHHSAIVVGEEQFKYLVQGEYVHFATEVDSTTGKLSAQSITGINNGQLMCETRRDVREQYRQHREHDTTTTTGSNVRPVSKPAPNKHAPNKPVPNNSVRRDNTQNRGQSETKWTKVVKKNIDRK